MKIASFRTRTAAVQYEESRRATHVFLELSTDDGVEGLGYASYTTRAADRAKALAPLLAGMAERIVGRDPLSIETIGAELRALASGPDAGEVMKAASVIDVALWDIKGKVLGMPLYQVLGAGGNTVPCYASWKLWPDLDETTVTANARGLVEQGFRAMKFRLGGIDEAAGVVRRAEALREAVGPGIELLADVNQGWDGEQAPAMGQALDGQRLFWLEDPVRHDRYEDLAALAATMETRICAGEAFHSLDQFRRLLENRAADIVMVDVMIGGISQWLKAAHLAEAYGLPVVSHLATEVLAHAVAAVPNGLIVEYSPWAMPLFKEAPQLTSEGELALSDRPGLGLEIDEKAFARHEVR